MKISAKSVILIEQRVAYVQCLIGFSISLNYIKSCLIIIMMTIFGIQSRNKMRFQWIVLDFTFDQSLIDFKDYYQVSTQFICFDQVKYIFFSKNTHIRESNLLFIVSKILLLLNCSYSALLNVWKCVYLYIFGWMAKRSVGEKKEI